LHAHGCSFPCARPLQRQLGLLNVSVVDVPTEKTGLGKCLSRCAEKRANPASWFENRIRPDSLLNQ
ncbi:MAG TPA: hypothetical protein VEO53_06210, partial [Candidatus Binatia bacterium]|nr:hypothetical protein [Candidatus Binatia bacterium]